MKKIFILISILFLLIKINKAQNLYPDPSFENYNYCPFGFDELSRGILRDIFPANQSYEANYYHKCGSLSYSVPITGFGFQYPRHGNGFVGIACYDEDRDNGYIEARLKDSLIAGKTYLVKFYVNHPNIFQFAIWKIGAYFSNDSLYYRSAIPITTVTPQIENDSGRFLTDTLNWMEICGLYHAHGGEKYMTIGTFYHMTATPILDMRPSTYHDDVFYFIEDVIVTDSTGSIDTINICNNDSILLAGEWQDTSGIYYDSFSCGTVKTWYLNVRPESSDFYYIDTTICWNESVIFNGVEYNITGEYIVRLNNVLGCDSVINLSLNVVGDNSILTRTLRICRTDSVFLDGAWRTRNGTYVDTMYGGSIFGCDSILTTILRIAPVTFNGTVSRTICLGDSTIISGRYIRLPGLYFDTLPNYTGCYDSAMQVIVIVRTDSSITTKSICHGQSILVNGNIVNSSGIYYDTLSSSITGCDSIVRITLTVLPMPIYHHFDTICSGNILNINSHSYSTPGIYYDTIIRISGCDSLLVTHLSLSSAYINNFYDTICQGTTILIGSNYYDSSGIYYDTIRRFGICDSIISTHLFVTPPKIDSLNLHSCYGDTITIASRKYYLSGNYFDTLQSLNSCDSIIYLKIIFDSVINSNRNISICNGSTIFLGNAIRSTAGIYIDTFISHLSCDSIVFTTLSINPQLNSSRTISICKGSSFYCGGNNQLFAGIYYDTFSSTVTGCDSTLETNLLIRPIDSTYQIQYKCVEDSLLIFGNYHNQTGIYIDTFVGIDGCDSIMFIEVKNYTIPSIYVGQDTTICNNTLIHLTAHGFGNFEWSNGTITNTLDSVINMSPLLLYAIITDSNNCTNSDSIYIETFPYLSAGLLDQNICIGGRINLVAYNGSMYNWNTLDTTSTISYNIDQDSMFSVSYIDLNGCLAIDTAYINVYPYLVIASATPDSIYLPNNIASLLSVDFIGIDSLIEWEPSNLVDSVNSQNTFAHVNSNTMFYVTVYTENGCIGKDSIMVYLFTEPKILVPTGFSPNNDGLNDYLHPILSESVKLIQFLVYNRWGETVFDYKASGEEKGWNGIYKGREQPMSTFTWVVEGINKFDGKKIFLSGNSTLIR